MAVLKNILTPQTFHAAVRDLHREGVEGIKLLHVKYVKEAGFPSANAVLSDIEIKFKLRKAISNKTWEALVINHYTFTDTTSEECYKADPRS